MQKNLILFIIFIIAAAALLVISSLPSGRIAPVSDDVSPLLVGGNAIYVADQRVGLSLNVSFAILGSDGYVVIHEDTGGVFGSIIGASEMLISGEGKDFSVTLSRYGIDGETLYAMLHSDNGDGEFNPSDDLPIKDNSGSTVFMRFMISSSAEDQPAAISL